MATIPSRTSFAWFRASLCNANQVSTCGCWPRKLEVRQLEINWKHIKKNMPPERIGHECCWIDVGASTWQESKPRSQKEYQQGVQLSVGFLYWYLPTPHFRPLHKLPKKMGFSPRIRLETSWNQGSTYTWRECDLLPAAPGVRKLSRATHLAKQLVCPPRMGLKLQMGCNIS